MRIERVSRRRYPAGLHQETHEHDRASVSLVLGGALTETAGGREVRLVAGDVLVKPRAVPHSDRYDGGAVVASIVLEDDLPRYVVNRGTAARIVTRILEGDTRWAALYDLEAALEDPEPGCRRTDRRMTEVAHLLATSATPIAGIARSLGMHRVALARAFRRSYGCSLTGFRLRARARRAADLLSGSDLPISEIALETGFADQSHLSRVLRRELGVPPRRFRSLAR